MSFFDLFFCEFVFIEYFFDLMYTRQDDYRQTGLYNLDIF